MMRQIFALACLATALAVPLSQNAPTGPTIAAVSRKCDSLFCGQSEEDLISFHAQSSTTPTVLNTVVAKEKTRALREVNSLATAGPAGSVFTLVSDPTAAPVLMTNGSKVTVSGMKGVAATLDFVSGLIVTSNNAGEVYTIDTKSGNATAVAQLPANKINANMSTSGSGMVYFVVADVDNSTNAQPMWYIAELNVASSTVSLSIGCPLPSGQLTTGATAPHGLNFMPANGKLAVMVSNILGPHVGFINPKNASDFSPVMGFLGPIIYTEHETIDRPGVTFVQGTTFYALMDASADGSNGEQMTWIDMTAKKPDIASADAPTGHELHSLVLLE